MYLQIVSDYVDIFLSESLSLRDRIVLAAKVSFFFQTVETVVQTWRSQCWR